MEGFVILWLLFAIGVGVLANSRGRSGIGFFLLSVLLSPLLGLIVVLVMRDEKAAAEAEDRRRRSEEMRMEEVRALAAAASRGATADAAPAVHPPSAAAAFKAPPMFSVADEITKLAALRDKGLLTQDEFNEQRRALLGASRPS